MVHAPTKERHEEILREVFARLQESGLAIKLSKCEFGKSSVEYLGYKVSEKGIEPLKKKVTAISENT